MKRVFISHPFRNNPSQNFAEILEIGKRLAKLGIAYFSPITNYCALDDTDGAQREFGLKCCEEWIGHCDCIFLCGDNWMQSAGCQKEISIAKLEPIPIYKVIGWKNDFPVFDGPKPDWLKGG